MEYVIQSRDFCSFGIVRLDIHGEGVIFIQESYDLLNSKMLKTLLIISTFYVAGELNIWISLMKSAYVRECLKMRVQFE